MSIQKYPTKFNYDTEISGDELEIIKKFLSFYRNQSFIVADEYRQDFDELPLENSRVVLRNIEGTGKYIDFCKKIFYKGKPYVVELSLHHYEQWTKAPNCLCINDFNIITNGETHVITLHTRDATKNHILFDIVSIFDEKKIISPEQAYFKQMYTDKTLQKFIENHEWQNIDKGIQQMPQLASALFIIGEDFERNPNYSANFGTILYQLISFRMNNLKNFDEKDLKQLDELILKLRKTKLLKVQLGEKVGGHSTYFSESILLESSDSQYGGIHMSQQCTEDNIKLTEEKKVLNKCIKNLRNNQN